MTNTSGAIVAEYTYDAYGNITSISGSQAADNPIRFSTKYFDVNTGYYDFGFRSYDPVTGRWLNRDPIGEEGGLNLYGFVGNSPENVVDGYGLFELRIKMTEVKPGFHHSFLVLHDEDSRGRPIATYFGGGPQFNTPSEFAINGFGNVTCEIADFTHPWDPARKERAKRTSESLLISAPGKSGKALRNRLYKVMSKIEEAGGNYNPVLGPNSNRALEVGIGMRLGDATTVTMQIGIWALPGWDTHFLAGTFGDKK